MEKTSTKTGLEVRVNILDQIYQIGRRVTNDVKEQIQVVFAAVLPKWNYMLTPTPA